MSKSWDAWRLVKSSSSSRISSHYSCPWLDATPTCNNSDFIASTSWVMHTEESGLTLAIESVLVDSNRMPRY
eukprot:758918-Hanusia_phi.AAC.3